MQSLSPRNCLKISLAILISMGISCATPKIDTASESQALEHEGHHPAAVETQKRSDGSDMKSNDGMMAGGKMDAGMMDKMKMKQMMYLCRLSILIHCFI